MPRAWARGRVLAMTPTLTRVTLELEVDGEHIEGHVLSRDGAKEPFAGWLGLAAALEAMIEKTRRT